MKKTAYSVELADYAVNVHITCNSKCAIHEHEFLELAYVLEGSMDHYFNETPIHLQAGDFFIVDYHVHHWYKQHGLTPLKVINCLFLPRIIDQTLQDCHSLGELLNHYLIKCSHQMLSADPMDLLFHDGDGKICRILHRMLNESEKKQAGYVEMMRCHLIELLIHTTRMLQPIETPLPEGDIIHFIREQVESRYTEPITLHSLCDGLGYSPAYLSSKFHQTMGVTFREFVKRTRVSQSCRLLSNTDLSIEQIAEQIGYSDVKYYYKNFKQVLGMTPLSFRKKHK